MKEYDIIVIGSGSGMIIVNEALAHGAKVALIDKGPRMGGTCLNYGCIPSKMLIHAADRMMEIKEAKKLGIDVKIENIDFTAIMNRMRKSRDRGERAIRQSIKHLWGVDFYNGKAQFVADYILQVNGSEIKGKNIFVATGSRPIIPPIKGLEAVNYLTNETVLELKKKPEDLIIIGGGYIGVEYAHFFSAMGTEVTVIEMADRLILSEEPVIAEVLFKELNKRMGIHLNTKALEVRIDGDGVKVIAENTARGTIAEYTANMLLLALGRGSNADLLKVQSTGVEVDSRGFIKVDKHLETSKKNIFAIGDANGQQMFTHAANREAAIAIDNVLHGAKVAMDHKNMPHAVYSYPPIASVGLTEKQARKKYEVLTGIARYFDVAKGKAMIEEVGFTKAIVDKENGKLLGFHIIGPYAPVLIQEVVNAMTSGGHVNEILQGIHIHPALSELIPMTMNELE